MRSLTGIFAVALLWAAAIQAAPGQYYTFVWRPRTTDVGPPGAADYQVLAGVLRLVPVVDYPVTSGDNFDFIIRKTFLVSQSLHNAYSLYVSRIEELNPGTDPQKLQPGQTLRLPEGPRYEATELTKEPVPTDALRSTFNRMSTRAYSLSGPSTDKIRQFSIRTLEAFVAPTKGRNPQIVWDAIVKRRLVGAVNMDKHPESTLEQAQWYTLKATSAAEMTLAKSLQKQASSAVLPSMIPMSAPVPVACNNICTTCAAVLKIPPGTDLSRTRVLVEDSGITKGIALPQNVLQQDSGGDGSDLDSFSHGTFVYSQISAPASVAEARILHGVLPKSNVYALRVVQKDTQTGDLDFSMTDIGKGWRAFEAKMLSDRQSPQTIVVNLSEAGADTNEPYAEPDVWDRAHLLIVAAAGNHHSFTEPRLAPFGLYSSGGTPLLIVGSLAADGQQANYSNFDSTHVQLFAQGDCVCGAPGSLSGTSQATPIVATAAAILASNNPTWFPLDVMWRLISTADRSPGLKSNGVFGGVVNLPQALDRYILIAEGSSPSQVTLHRAASVTFSDDWGEAITQLNLNDTNAELLRVYNPTARADGKICLDTVQKGSLTHTQVCTDPASTLSYSQEGAAGGSIRVSQVQDLMLPVDAGRDEGTEWPSVAIGSGS